MKTEIVPWLKRGRFERSSGNVRNLSNCDKCLCLLFLFCICISGFVWQLHGKGGSFFMAVKFWRRFY